jgi:hypothetical protein
VTERVRVNKIVILGPFVKASGRAAPFFADTGLPVRAFGPLAVRPFSGRRPEGIFLPADGPEPNDKGGFGPPNPPDPLDKISITLY